MISKDDVVIRLPEEDLREIELALKVLKEKLMPHLISLSMKDRKQMAKMADKSVSFVEKSLSYCNHNPEFLPPFVNYQTFKGSYEAVTVLRRLENALKGIVKAVNDSRVYSGSIAYQAALAYYNSVSYGLKAKVPSAETIFNDLSARFPQRRRRKKKEDGENGSE